MIFWCNISRRMEWVGPYISVFPNIHANTNTEFSQISALVVELFLVILNRVIAIIMIRKNKTSFRRCSLLFKTQTESYNFYPRNIFIHQLFFLVLLSERFDECLKLWVKSEAKERFGCNKHQRGFFVPSKQLVLHFLGWTKNDQAACLPCEQSDSQRGKTKAVASLHF